jgi:hypothetical protein
VSYHTGKEKDALLVVLKISGILEWKNLEILSSVYVQWEDISMTSYLFIDYQNSVEMNNFIITKGPQPLSYIMISFSI